MVRAVGSREAGLAGVPAELTQSSHVADTEFTGRPYALTLRAGQAPVDRSHSRENAMIYRMFPVAGRSAPAAAFGTLVLGLAVALSGCDRSPTRPAAGPSVDAAASQTGRPDGVPVPLFRVNVWGNDVEWQMLDSHEPSEAGDESYRPFYVIAPVDAASPQSTIFWGSHDHVVPVPPHSNGTYTAVWHLVFVLPADGATTGSDIGDEADVLVRSTNVGNLAYAADLDGDGTVESDEVFTSEARIDAAEDAGLVEVTDSIFPDFIFICPVRPL